MIARERYNRLIEFATLAFLVSEGHWYRASGVAVCINRSRQQTAFALRRLVKKGWVVAKPVYYNTRHRVNERTTMYIAAVHHAPEHVYPNWLMPSVPTEYRQLARTPRKN